MNPEAAIRIDICFCQEPTQGLETLLEGLEQKGIRATFCVAAGPDRSGLALLNALFEPGFLRRMLRLNPLRIYGWRTLLAGTLRPAGPVLSTELGSWLGQVHARGHDVALHGWDHRGWQNQISRWPVTRINAELTRAAGAFQRAGLSAQGSAAPAWRTTNRALNVAAQEGLAWASDLRGPHPLQPIDALGRRLGPPQIPVNLPTLDELLAWPDCPDSAARLAVLRAAARDLLRREEPPPLVYAAHPEVDGRGEAETFFAFVDDLRQMGLCFRTLGDLSGMLPTDLPVAELDRRRCRGRGGWVAAAGPDLPWLTRLSS